jgi:hypothetical protein
MKRLLPIALLFLVFAGTLHAQTGSQGFKWSASPSAAANPTLTYTLFRMSGACPATAPTAEPGGFTAIQTGITGTTATDKTITPGTWCYTVAAVVGTNISIASNPVAVIWITVLPPGSLVAIAP